MEKVLTLWPLTRIHLHVATVLSGALSNELCVNILDAIRTTQIIPKNNCIPPVYQAIWKVNIKWTLGFEFIFGKFSADGQMEHTRPVIAVKEDGWRARRRSHFPCRNYVTPKRFISGPPYMTVKLSSGGLRVPDRPFVRDPLVSIAWRSELLLHFRKTKFPPIHC